MGVDVRVHKVLIYGLPLNAENLLQEGGRPMRGSMEETKGARGYTFIFHKGRVGIITDSFKNICNNLIP